MLRIPSRRSALYVCDFLYTALSAFDFLFLAIVAVKPSYAAVDALPIAFFFIK